MIYITSILFTLAFVFYSKYQFADDKVAINSGKWHPFGMFMRGLFFVAIYINTLLPVVWEDFLLASSINILLFEMGINLIALNQKLFYRGYTSKLDQKLGQTKWILMFAFLLITIIIKYRF